MNAAYLKTTKRLSKVLPESVFWLSNKQLCELLGVSEATRKRDHAVLSALGLIPQNWKYRTGYDRDKIETFWEFRQLHSMSDRNHAIQNIKLLMGMIQNEQQRSGTCQGSNPSTAERTATAIRTA